MQVYKLFLKILRSQLGQMIMYICIFTGIVIAVTNANLKEMGASYESIMMKVTVDDRDQSEVSKAFVDYLDKTMELDDIRSFDKEVIQDEMFNRSFDAIIVIPEGMGDKVKSGDYEDVLEVYTLPGTFMGNIVISNVDSYLSSLSAYLKSGDSVANAVAALEEISDVSVDVDMINKANDKDLKYYFFQYMAYVFIAIAFTGAIPVLIVLNQEKVRARTNVSAYKLNKTTAETALGLITVGVMICVVFIVLGIAMTGFDEVFSANGGLYVLNMFVYMIMAIGMAYFFGQLVNKENLVSMLANVVGLGMSFLGGVFVPLEFLSDGVIKAAHFLPSYWYIRGLDFAKDYNGGSVSELFGYLGIQLLFAAVFFVAGGIVIKVKRDK